MTDGMVEGMAEGRADGAMPPVLVVTGMAFEAALARAGAEASSVAVLHGLRADTLAREVDWRLAEAAASGTPFGGVLSFGVAGGLTPGLFPGALIVADGIAADGARIPADAAWTGVLHAALPQAHAGWLAAGDEAVMTIGAKADLHARTGALAADMESHRAAAAARRHGVPFAACRVVIDPATRAVPPAAMAGMGPDGQVDLWALLRSLARQPSQLGGLLALSRDAAAARAALRTARAGLGDRFLLPARINRAANRG